MTWILIALAYAYINTYVSKGDYLDSIFVAQTFDEML